MMARRKQSAGHTAQHAEIDGPVLTVTELRTHFLTEQGEVTAVDGISLRIAPNEVVGIVGESGCGKSVFAQSVMRLHDESVVSYEGEIDFRGRDILSASERELETIRGEDIAMVFQDPLNSLNPVMKIGAQIAEPLILHRGLSRSQARERAIELLQLTGVPAPTERVDEYPHELSGGMRQRVMIAIALACQPRLLIADEPTTALDVTVQAQVLDLIRNLRDEFGTSLLFITHDLGVVAELCDRVVVMYLGQAIEEATVDQVFAEPLHPYTQGLMASAPDMDADRTKELSTIPGTVPPLTQVPKGCRFAARCPFATELCVEQMPELREVDGDRRVRCWHAERIRKERQGVEVGA